MTTDEHVLDNPAWHSLSGPHADFSEGNGLAKRYRPDVSIFGAVRDWTDPGVWDAIIDGVQLVQTDRLQPAPDDEAITLGESDVPEMLALVERTRPGPFLTGTRLLGTYLGIRREGQLVAMAGERLHPAGWTEISAVCTDAAHRGQGLAGRLVLAVAWNIQSRGERALLHTGAANATAIALYERLGFTLRRRTRFGAVRTPA